MKRFDVEQGSPEWFRLRLGRPTASSFNRIITPKTGKLSAQADGYIDELIGESLSLYTPEGVENYTNRAMRWGQQCEAEARSWYSLTRNIDVEGVGFLTTDDGRFGCSPDGLVGEDGGLELKCPQPATQVGYLRAGQVLPCEYKGQVHGSLIVSGRQWWDFVSYAPGLPPILVRVTPDEYTEQLRKALEEFWEKYQAVFEQIKGSAA